MSDYKEGDKIVDLNFNQVFEYLAERDKVMIEREPERFECFTPPEPEKKEKKEKKEL